jgi:regulator of nucleoside diphosphate kinase
VNDFPCLLTIGDFATLESLAKRWAERGHDLATLLRAKMDSAKVVFPDDLPRDAASLGSRIEYAIGDDVRIATLTGEVALAQEWLPLTLPEGLALLGRREGWSTNFKTSQGRFRPLTLCRVLEQPEANWPGRFSICKPSGTVVALGTAVRSQQVQPINVRAVVDDDDDPGPAAA